MSFCVEVSIRLSVIANTHGEAMDIVRRGLKEGRYANDATITYYREPPNGWSPSRTETGKDDEGKPWYFFSHTRFGFWYEKQCFRTRAEAIAKRRQLREDGLQATAIYDKRKEGDS